MDPLRALALASVALNQLQSVQSLNLGTVATPPPAAATQTPPAAPAPDTFSQAVTNALAADASAQPAAPAAATDTTPTTPADQPVPTPLAATPAYDLAATTLLDQATATAPSALQAGVDAATENSLRFGAATQPLGAAVSPAIETQAVLIRDAAAVVRQRGLLQAQAGETGPQAFGYARSQAGQALRVYAVAGTVGSEPSHLLDLTA